MTAPKLECYAMSERPAQLVPAPAERDWMDATNQHFAYRCTPLSIANASGWELLNPIGFTATWTSWNGKEDVIVRSHEPGVALHQVGLFFGHGILSFHPGYLFKTDPDWMMQVRGSPNRLKDGIQALDGLVETGWLPFTFTMNWKFTRPCTVHFEKDEPFCFITLVPAVTIESVQPVIQRIAENPELNKEYKTWTSERTKFNAALNLGDPLANEQKWQKNYLVGKSPSGNSVGGENHRVKRGLKKPIWQDPSS